MGYTSLEAKVAVVTGAGQGLGKAYAEALAGRGAAVVIAEVNGLAAETVANEIRRQGRPALAIQTDVADEGQVAAMVDKTLAAFGRIDILVNNAGVFLSLFPGKPFHDISTEEWDRVMAVNVRGLFLCAKAVFPAMKEQAGGSIINISSSVVHIGIPNWLHYVTSKSAVIGLTRALAREVGQFGIRVNAVTPGFTSSEGVKERYAEERVQAYAAHRCLVRPEVPEDLVGTILFLASADSSFITGQTINVDGGAYMH